MFKSNARETGAREVPAEEQKVRRFSVWMIFAMLAVAAATAVCVADNRAVSGGQGEEPTTLAQASPMSSQAITQASQSFVELARRATPAVVNIEVEKRVSFGGGFNSPHRGRDPFFDFFERFGIPEQDRVQRGQGSGFVISDDGYIVTNNHVVDDAEKVTVNLVDKRSFQADVVGVDPKTDLALLKIKNPEKLPTLPLGDSNRLEVGEWVVAIGNPFGLSHTVTAGIVSAKGRVLGASAYDDFIQTDASINPGNSGGPLINTRGEVVGINAMINASGQGIGFAIPASLAKDVIAQLQQHGSVTRGWLGVGIQDVTKEMSGALGLDSTTGAMVRQVFDNSPASEAGFKPADVIVRFDGKPIKDSHELPLIVAQTTVGKDVDVEVIRDRKPTTLKVRLGRMPEDETKLKAQDDREELGLTVRDVPPEIAQALGLKPGQGVLVIGLQSGGSAQDAGLRRNDVVLEVNREPIKDAESFSKLVQKTPKGEAVLLMVKRQDDTFFTTLTR